MNLVEVWQKKSNVGNKQRLDEYRSKHFEINKRIAKEKLENIKQFYKNENYDCGLIYDDDVKNEKLLIKLKNRNATLDVIYTHDIGEPNNYLIGAIDKDSDLMESDIYTLYDDGLILYKEIDVINFIKEFEEEIIWKKY